MSEVYENRAAAPRFVARSLLSGFNRLDPVVAPALFLEIGLASDREAGIQQLRVHITHARRETPTPECDILSKSPCITRAQTITPFSAVFARDPLVLFLHKKVLSDSHHQKSIYLYLLGVLIL